MSLGRNGSWAALPHLVAQLFSTCSVSVTSTDLSPVLWTDDTPVTVLVGGDQGSRRGRFWTYIGQQHPYSVYDFTESRARDGPASFLQGFEGYLHADAYGGYDQIYLGSNDAVREVACWAHARRKFFEARRSRTAQSARPRAYRPFLRASRPVGVVQSSIRTLICAQLVHRQSLRRDSPTNRASKQERRL
jgi:hypothetical protein